MELFEFVCRAPDSYFRSKSTPYNRDDVKPELAAVVTSSGAEVIRAPDSRDALASEVDVGAVGSAREERVEGKGEKRSSSTSTKKTAKRVRRDKDDDVSTSRKNSVKSSASETAVTK